MLAFVIALDTLQPLTEFKPETYTEKELNAHHHKSQARTVRDIEHLSWNYIGISDPSRWDSVYLSIYGPCVQGQRSENPGFPAQQPRRELLLFSIHGSQVINYLESPSYSAIEFGTEGCTFISLPRKSR